MGHRIYQDKEELERNNEKKFEEQHFNVELKFNLGALSTGINF